MSGVPEKDAELKGRRPSASVPPDVQQGCPQTVTIRPHALCSPLMAGLGPVVGLKQGLQGELHHLDLVPQVRQDTGSVGIIDITLPKIKGVRAIKPIDV